MKSGRATKWAAWVFHWEEQEENRGACRFIDWEDFKGKFWKEFCPSYTDFAAINQLESAAYFQKNCSIDDYIDLLNMSTIFSDNQAAIAIAHHPKFHAYTKHIDI